MSVKECIKFEVVFFFEEADILNFWCRKPSGQSNQERNHVIVQADINIIQTICFYQNARMNKVPFDPAIFLFDLDIGPHQSISGLIQSGYGILVRFQSREEFNQLLGIYPEGMKALIFLTDH